MRLSGLVTDITYSDTTQQHRRLVPSPPSFSSPPYKIVHRTVLVWHADRGGEAVTQHSIPNCPGLACRPGRGGSNTTQQQTRSYHCRPLSPYNHIIYHDLPHVIYASTVVPGTTYASNPHTSPHTITLPHYTTPHHTPYRLPSRSHCCHCRGACKSLLLSC